MYCGGVSWTVYLFMFVLVTNYVFFYVLITVHLSIILATGQLNPLLANVENMELSE